VSSRVVVQTPEADEEAEYSPDGRAVAYQVGVGFHADIYVQPCDGLGPRIKIDTGANPAWNAHDPRAQVPPAGTGASHRIP
jgi:hypothetical protein